MKKSIKNLKKNRLKPRFRVLEFLHNETCSVALNKMYNFFNCQLLVGTNKIVKILKDSQ